MIPSPEIFNLMGFSTQPLSASQVTPIAFKNIGWHYYILYVVCNATNALTFWALFPETASIPIEEMDQLFSETPVIVLCL